MTTSGALTRVTRLESGLTIATHQMPWLETVSLGVWVACGARHESLSEHGISHLLEHMAFKGTARRTAREIVEEIEQVGGELNAATSLESTAYYARVLKGDDGIAIDLLADIVQHSTYDLVELEREREVILQEIAATRDSPDEIAYDMLHDAAFPGQPLGRPILGTPESVTGFTPDDLRRFLGQRYGADRMVLSAAGAVDHDALVRHAEALFAELPRRSTGDEQAARYEGGRRASDKPFEQAHVLFGFEGPSYRRDDFFTGQVFSGLLGGSMSSRLFQEVREKRGLCYAIYSTSWGLSDSGLLGIHAATGAEMVEELIDVTAGELKAVAQDGVTQEELARAKAQLKAGLMIGLESSSARAEQMARQLIAYGRLIGKEELLDRVEGVTGDAVRGFAAGLLSPGRPTVAVVGAGPRSVDYAARAEAVLGG